MYKASSVQITHSGRSYNGSFRVADGVLSVDSAYGSGSRKLGRYEARAMAERMLKEQVEAWRKGKALGAQMPKAS